MPRKTAIASGESRRREPAGWDESGIGAARSDAPVDMRGAIEPIDTMESKRADSICRTAVYVTRMHGGVGGRGREVPSYPDVCRAWHEASRVRVPVPGSSRAEGQPKGKCVVARRGAEEAQGEIAGRRTEAGYEA